MYDDCNLGKDGSGHHGNHGLFGGLDVVVDIGVRLRVAETLAKGKRSDDVESEVLDLAGEIDRLEVSIGGDILRLNEVNEAGNLLVNVCLEIVIFLASILFAANEVNYQPPDFTFSIVRDLKGSMK